MQRINNTSIFHPTVELSVHKGGQFQFILFLILSVNLLVVCMQFLRRMFFFKSRYKTTSIIFLSFFESCWPVWNNDRYKAVYVCLFLSSNWTNSSESGNCSLIVKIMLSSILCKHSSVVHPPLGPSKVSTD